MAILIIKIIVCSSLLLLFYQIFLAREKTFQFNRFFLLAAILFAYSVPFIVFDVPSFKETKSKLIFGEIVPVLQKTSVSNSTNFNVENILVTIYILVSLFFLVKFFLSVSKILLLKGEIRIYKTGKIKILEQNEAPFSFLNTIYIGRKYLKNDQIDERIFLHENNHIIEKHSIDILFLEILKIFSWFNPLLFFYKKAMIINHEFIADEYVLRKNFDIRNYQYLILDEIKNTQRLALSHQFNFNETKKRFIMMTTKTSKFSGVKKLALLPVLVILFVSFTNTTQSEVVIEKNPKENNSATERKDVALPVSQNTVNTEEKELLKILQKPENAVHIKMDTLKPTVVEKTSDSFPPAPPKKNQSVDVLPAYPGGINEFRTLVNKNFNTTIFTGQEGLMKSTIYFTIDESGNVSNFGSEGDNAKFNEEALRSIKFSNQDKMWTPATKDGKNVAYVFKMPLTMYFAK